MESKDELKEIQNYNRACYFFDDIIGVREKDIDFNDVLLDEKLYKEKYENILIYDISYKNLTGWKPLRIWFDKTDGFIKINLGIAIWLQLVWWNLWWD